MADLPLANKSGGGVAIAFIGLGSNLGDRKAYLLWAVEQMDLLPDTTVVHTSQWHETAPVGGPPQGMFLNGVAEIQTALAPEALLQHLQEIEQQAGRPQDHERWGPRVIDLDLLSYDGLALETPTLTVPHPRMHERRFVLEPLTEIAPRWVHPKLGKTAHQLLAEAP